MDESSDLWREYYARALSFPHAPLTEIAARNNSSGSKVAIDAGCGTGSDAQFLVDAGYLVHAFDINTDSVEICQSRFMGEPLVKVSCDSFEAYDYPKSGLFIANSSLYFSEPSEFENTWGNIVSSIEAGGVFAGDFMGVEDDWAFGSRHTINSLTQSEVKALFEGFEIIKFNERNALGKTAIGKSKRWHTYTIIATKRN